MHERQLSDEGAMGNYTVLVDDNFHYMDESERSTVGDFDTLEEAIAVCKHRVDRDLDHCYELGMTEEQLFDNYKSFGEDPFIVGPADGVPFSAWTYAQARCAEIVQAKS